jgi:hypothetical protein
MMINSPQVTVRLMNVWQVVSLLIGHLVWGTCNYKVWANTWPITEP